MSKTKGIIDFYKWLLNFHPLKYLGIFVMIIGPLVLIYRFIFLGSQLYEMALGSIGFLVIGSFIWVHGWDPYR